MGGLLDHWATEKADDPFIVCGTQSFTFGEMKTRSDAIAATLNSLGVHKGDRLAVVSPNRMEMIDLYFAAAKLGAVQVPINVFLKGDFLRHQLRDCQASVLVLDHAGMDAVQPMLTDLADVRQIITMDNDAPVSRAGIRQLPFADLISNTQEATFAGPDPSDPMSIMYTSGTTGLPKGCVLSHAYYTRVAREIITMLNIDATDSLYSTLPLFHSGAQMMVLGAAVWQGIPVAIDAGFSPSTFLPRCRELGSTVAIGMGVMGTAMLTTPPSPADTDHNVHTMFMAPMTPDNQQRFHTRFGIDPFVEVFGQTECIPVMAGRRGGTRHRATAGWPVHDLEVAVLDDNGQPVPEGEVGEICLRPHDRFAIFSGYWNDPAKTLEQFTGLWYHTGDNGRQLPDGTYAFSDRKKDSLRRRGENVSSMELEAVITTHPAITEAAVHAVPAALGEDDIKACVVTAPDTTLTPAEVFAFFADNLPYFAVPRYVEFLDSLPRNAVGRVMKHHLPDSAGDAKNNKSRMVWDFEALGLEIARDARRHPQRHPRRVDQHDTDIDEQTPGGEPRHEPVIDRG